MRAAIISHFEISSHDADEDDEDGEEEEGAQEGEELRMAWSQRRASLSLVCLFELLYYKSAD